MPPRPLPVVGAPPPPAAPGPSLRALLAAAGLGPGAAPGGPDPLAGLAALALRHRAEALAALQARLARDAARLEAARLAPAEVERRLTLALRALDEAGRHPDPEVRRALGVLAARGLVEAPGALPGVEAVHLLGRLTALDLALLAASVAAGVLVHDRPPAARPVVGDAPPGLTLDEGQPRPLPPAVRRPEELARALAGRVAGVTAEAVRLASQRLRRLGLFFPEHAYGQPNDAGRELAALVGEV